MAKSSGGAGRIGRSGTEAQIGDFVQEYAGGHPTAFGRVVARGSLGKAPVLRLSNGTYAVQGLSRIVGARR